VPPKESQEIPALQAQILVNRFSRLAKSPDGHLGRHALAGFIHKITKETYMFQLLFLEDRYIHPIAQIFLKCHECNGSDDLISVAPECSNATEMDQQIDRLQAGLETLRNEMHRQFASERPSLGGRHE
jgi:hypothetical protein